MDMNIGPMLRAMLGETTPADGKALELRIGQIVRGMLMEMLDNREALMNINGVSVRAKLEADLQVGRGTLLQVQSGGSGGTVVLKPLAETSEALPDEGLKNMLKSFGLPDQKWSYELIRGLKRDGYAIGKETGAFFLAAAAFKPASADSASWMAAADVAFRRGLTASEETLASLRQTLFGQPLHEGLSSFASALEEWLGANGAKSPQAASLGGRLQALLAEGEKLLAQGETQMLGDVSSPNENTAGKTAVSRAAAQPAAALQAAEPESLMTHANPALGGQPGSAAGTAGMAGQPATAQTSNIRQAAFDIPQVHASALGSQASPALNGVLPDTSSSAASPSLPNAAADSKSRTPVSGDAAANDPAAAASHAPSRGETAWIGRFLQWLGAGHEHRLLNASDPRLPADPDTSASGLLPSSNERPAPESARNPSDSLKSALLSLAARDETPPALRDAAQSLVNQITGQQLLLSSERQPNIPFSLMTLFVPMKSQDGDTTATVHVQTRRSRKGEWDTDNCRLLFDLRMRHLGDTVVDVQVVDRIVSVKLMNDFPGMPEMVEQAKEEVGAALRDAGFQLLSMTSQTLPSLREASAADSGERSDKTDHLIASAYAAKPYKGVDFRV